MKVHEGYKSNADAPLLFCLPPGKAPGWTDLTPELPKIGQTFYRKRLFVRTGIFTGLCLYLLSLAALIVSRCVSHQPVGCWSFLLMDWLMVSICYCFTESLCGLLTARSVPNQRHRLISTHSSFSFLTDTFCWFSFSVFPPPPLNLFSLCWNNLWKVVKERHVQSRPPSPPHIPEKTHPLAREKGGKKFLFEKTPPKKTPRKSSLGTDLNSCVIIYFQCQVPGISALEWGVEMFCTTVGTGAFW